MSSRAFLDGKTTAARAIHTQDVAPATRLRLARAVGRNRTALMRATNPAPEESIDIVMSTKPERNKRAGRTGTTSNSGCQAAALAALARGSSRSWHRLNREKWMTEHKDAGTLVRQIEEEHIARLAYAIYEARGRADGHAEDDWFRAVAAYAARHHPRSPKAVRSYGPSSSFADRVRESLE